MLLRDNEAKGEDDNTERDRPVVTNPVSLLVLGAVLLLAICLTCPFTAVRRHSKGRLYELSIIPVCAYCALLLLFDGRCVEQGTEYE